MRLESKKGPEFFKANPAGLALFGGASLVLAGASDPGKALLGGVVVLAARVAGNVVGQQIGSFFDKYWKPFAGHALATGIGSGIATLSGGYFGIGPRVINWIGAVDGSASVCGRLISKRHRSQPDFVLAGVALALLTGVAASMAGEETQEAVLLSGCSLMGSSLEYLLH